MKNNITDINSTSTGISKEEKNEMCKVNAHLKLENRFEQSKQNKPFIWKQKFLDKDRNQIEKTINMRDMGEDFLQNISYKCQNKINELQKQLDIYSDLLEQIDIVAGEEGYTLKEVATKVYVTVSM